MSGHGVHAVQHEVEHKLEHDRHEGDHHGGGEKKSTENQNRKIALLIAVIALFLAFSETLGKAAQTEAISANVEAANLWAFFQAKTIRRTLVETAAQEMTVTAAAVTNEAAKGEMAKQIAFWKGEAARYRSEAQTREGSTELAARAKESEKRRDISMAKYHHYEVASAAYQIGIVLASSAVITGIVLLAYAAAVLGVAGIVFTCIGFFAPHAVHLF
jgi:Domain of unknown function (DUF4337)